MASKTKGGIPVARIPFSSLSIGDPFRPLAYKASYDMDFSLECLYCSGSRLKGYQVEDENGVQANLVVCEDCGRVNGAY
jgi:hypothetical protein|nr:hypothetical protein [Bacillota bacterium]